MDFSKQCRRFINFNLINEQNFKRKLSNISAIGILKSTTSLSVNKSFESTTNSLIEQSVPNVTYKIVIADNDEKSLVILNESDGKIVIEKKGLGFLTYSLCCTRKPNKNFIYLSDHLNNVIRKFDENLNEVNKLKMPSDKLGLNGPCGISINQELNRICVVDQKNLRIVTFDLTTDEYLSEFQLFEDDLNGAIKYAHQTSYDLSARTPFQHYLDSLKNKEKLDFWPFGINTRGERVYVTDWNRGLLYIYKMNKLETKIGNQKSFSKPRDIVLDSNGYIMLSDLDQEKVFVLDNRGTYLFETKVPRNRKNKLHNGEKGVFGIVALDNSRLVFASNTSVYICNLFG